MSEYKGLPKEVIGEAPKGEEENQLTSEQRQEKERKAEEDITLKVGDEVIVAGVTMAVEPTKGRVVELQAPGTDRPTPKVMLTEGPNAGQTVGPLYFSEYKKPGSEFKLVNEGL